LAGAIGTLRFGSFYERIHAPTLGTSWGTGAVALASIVCFSALGSRLAVHELLIAFFVTVTTPVTLMLLACAALYRDRTEGEKDVPGKAWVNNAGRDVALPERGDAG
jgi:multicomponent K+:H+ antiporter subunit G